MVPTFTINEIKKEIDRKEYEKKETLKTLFPFPVRQTPSVNVQTPNPTVSPENEGKQEEMTRRGKMN
jgi:hypothetical protein